MTTGKSKSDFPGAFIPFDIAVGPVPTVSIDSAPTSQICVNNEWLPFVLGALKALTRPETWKDTYDNSVIAASEFAALVGNISDGCGVIVPSKGCFSANFKDLDYGFVVTPGANCDATWDSPTGWRMCCDSTPKGWLQIKREFGTETIINGFHLTIKTVSPYLIDYDITLFDNGDFVSIANSTAVSGPTIVIDVNNLEQPASALFIQISETFAGCAADAILEDWSLCYTGAFPLSLPNPDSFIHVFDFANGQQGWYIDSGNGSFVTDRFVSSFNGSDNILRVDLNIDAALQITGIDVVYSVTNDKGGTAALIRAFNGTTLVFGDSVSDGDTVVDRSVSLVTPITGKTVIVFSCDAHGTNQSTLQSVTIHGIGPDPF